MNVKEIASLRRIFTFIGLTFLISWVLLGIMFIANKFGFLIYGTISGLAVVALVGAVPAISCFILYKKWKVVSGFRNFVFDIFKNCISLKMIIGIIIFFGIHFFTGIFFGIYNGNPLYLLIVFTPLMIIGGGLEEPGWRGFLQPAFEKYLPLPIATIATGITWAVWHLPLWFINGSSQSNSSFVLFMFYCIVLSFILNAVLKVTDCIFACVLFHAWCNVIGGMYNEMIFGNIKITIFYIIEIIIFSVFNNFIVKYKYRK
jgi:uncharacterized protein